MSFLEFLKQLSNNKLEPNFIEMLITLPNDSCNDYWMIGDRWCSVEGLLANNRSSLELLHQYAFKEFDPTFSFSACNLKAQYIPDEEFINNGSAIIIYSIVGSEWRHTIRVGDQLSLWEGLLPKPEVTSCT